MTATAPAAENAAPRDHDIAAPGMATDPVCGMSVDPATARHRAEHAGTQFFFCGARCRERFTAEPERFAGIGEAGSAGRGGAVDLPDAPADRARRGRLLPDLRHGAGTVIPAAGADGNPELADMTRRFWLAAALSAAAAGDGDALAFGLAGRGLAPAHPRHPGGAVGGRAVLPARLGIGRQPPAQHVHPDRAGDRRRLSLQPCRGAGARHLPGILS